MSHPTRIPANVDVADKILGPLTARQAAQLAIATIVLYGLWRSTEPYLAPVVFLLLAGPLAVMVAVIVLGKRDGTGLDRFLAAALRHASTPRRRVSAAAPITPAPAWITAHTRHETGTATPHNTGQHTGRAHSTAAAPRIAPLRLPPELVAASRTGLGVISLGSEGLAAVAAVSTVHFRLHTPAERDALVGVLARYLHSLTGGVQIIVRAQPTDLSRHITELREYAPLLAHPALSAHALAHARYLAGLARTNTLLRRQVLIVVRESLTAPASPGMSGTGGPSPAAMLRRLLGRTPATSASEAAAARDAAAERLSRRLDDAADLLAPAGLIVTPLDAAHATAILASTCQPGGPPLPTADMAPASEPVTARETPPATAALATGG